MIEAASPTTVPTTPANKIHLADSRSTRVTFAVDGCSSRGVTVMLDKEGGLITRIRIVTRGSFSLEHVLAKTLCAVFAQESSDLIVRGTLADTFSPALTMCDVT
jgi:hypothetical protein